MLKLANGSEYRTGTTIFKPVMVAEPTKSQKNKTCRINNKSKKGTQQIATIVAYLCITKQGQLHCSESVFYESQLGQMEAVLPDFWIWSLLTFSETQTQAAVTTCTYKTSILVEARAPPESRNDASLTPPIYHSLKSRDMGASLWYNTSPWWCRVFW